MIWIPLGVSSERLELAVYVLGAITIFYVVFRPMLRKKRDPLEKLPSMSLSTQRTVEREMQNVLVEMSEMARQISAQLDTRSAKLAAMIEEADRRIEELNRLERGQASSGDGSARPSHLSPALAEPLTPALSQREREKSTVTRGPSPEYRGEGVESSAEGEQDRYAEVHTLADQGCTPMQIAQRLGRPVGEVELILALRVT